MQDESEIVTKMVRGKSTLIPSLAMVETAIATGNPNVPVDRKALREGLARQYGSDATCPVTVRRHLKALNRL
jgi:hypothetical protein